MLRRLLVGVEENEMAEQLAQILGNALLYIAILAVFIVLLLVVASKLFKEELEFVQYLTTSSMLFSAGIAVYMIIVMVVYTSVEKGSLSADEPFRLYVTIFAVAFPLLIGPALFFVRDTFMFFTQRFIVAFMYAFIVSILYIFATV